MASKYVTLWSTPGTQSQWGGTPGTNTRVVYDDKNKAYWGQHKQEDLITQLTKLVGDYTKQIADGGITYNYGGGGIYGIGSRFDRFNDQRLQETKQALTNTQKYLEGIQNNYTQFKDFELSYDKYQGDWQALFDQTFKNTRIEADNLAKAANVKEANENARGIQGDSSGAVESLAIKPNKTKGTGIKTAADTPGSTGFKTGLGV